MQRIKPINVSYRIWKKYQRQGLGALTRSVLVEPFNYARFRWYFCGLSDARATKLIEVNPEDIVYTNARRLRILKWRGRHLEDFIRRGYFKYCGLEAVVDGSWDRDVIPFAHAIEYRMVFERYGCGLSWNETESYRVLMDYLNRGGIVFGCRTREDLDRRLGYVDALATSIQRNGYLRSSDIEEHGGPGVSSSSNRDRDEVVVNISRDGDLLYHSLGRHRLALAKVLGIEKIPVLVKVRHKGWQDIRDEIRSTSKYSDLSERVRKNLDHPDMQDIVPVEWRDSAPVL